jgi:hypothetical protein
LTPPPPRPPAPGATASAPRARAGILEGLGPAPGAGEAVSVLCQDRLDYEGPPLQTAARSKAASLDVGRPTAP